MTRQPPRGGSGVDDPLWGDRAPARSGSSPADAAASPAGAPGPDGAPQGPGDGDGWGPTVAGRRRRRPLRTLVVVLLAVLLVVGAVTAAFVTHALASIERVAVEGLEPALTGPLNVLVVGNDSRDDLTAEQRRELTTGSVTGQRTDTMFVLSVRGGEAAILAFPRDLYVERCDGTDGRINAALSIGGPTCLVRTVTATSGIPIDHYLEVSLAGFTSIVDAVGGVTLCLDDPIADRDAGIDLPAGCQVLGPADALGYVRVRKIDSDLERIKRQQRFVAALATAVTSPETVRNPVRAWETVGAIGRSLRADDDLGPVALGRLAWASRGIASGDLISETVPTTGVTVDGASVLVPIEAEAEALYAEFRDGSVHDRAPTTIERSDVRVRVLNAAGVDGLAGRTGDALAVLGYRVTELGNEAVTPTTVIRHAPGQRDAAELVAGDLPDELGIEPVFEEVEGIEDLTVVLGQDAVGV